MVRGGGCFGVRGNQRFTLEEKGGAESDAIDAGCHDAGAVEQQEQCVREHGRNAEPGSAAQPSEPSALKGVVRLDYTLCRMGFFLQLRRRIDEPASPSVDKTVRHLREPGAELNKSTGRADATDFCPTDIEPLGRLAQIFCN